MKGFVSDAEFITRQEADLVAWQRKIKQMMREKNVRTYTLAKGTGLCRTNIIKVLNDKRYPTLSTMSRIHLFLENYEK